jgi:glycine/D-amino acid oxidase-like deaminating enzyme
VRHESYWERGVPLQPAATELPARVDTLIVGAGFMGSWLAYWIAKLKPSLAKSTLVVERDLLGYGASTRNAGFLTSGNISEMYADARDAGQRAVFDTCVERRAGITVLLEEFGDVLATDPCGSGDFDSATPEKIAFKDALNAYLLEMGQEAAFTTRRVWFGGREQEVFFNVADRGVNPISLLKLLRERAAFGGVKFAFGVNVLKAGDGEAVCALSDTAEGGRATARYRHALICINAFASDLNAESAVVPGRGQVIVTSPVRAQTSHMLGFLDDGYDYFKFVDGRVLLGGGRHKFRSAEQTTNLTPTAELRDYLTQRAREIIGHANFKVDYHWAGIMGFPGGGHTPQGHRVNLDASTESLNACGGMGVALTPIVARDLATGL